MNPQTAGLPITFFYTDNCERQAIEPIAREAKSRGYEVLFNTDARNYADVGVYCQHACTPNSKFSVIMLHDLAQRHDIWPNFWRHEPWHRFDLGFLPGKSWVDRWNTQAHFQSSRTRLGVFDTGWPKSDLVFKDRAVFLREGELLREKYKLKHAKTILYAPSWENDFKQDDFVKSFIDLPVNLLIKQAPWPKNYPEVLEKIREMNLLHDGLAPNIHIIDPEVSIMYCLGIADVLVSDESSVLTEALLVGVPPVAVVDWLIPDQKPHRLVSVPYDYVIKTTRKQLRDDVLRILDNCNEISSKLISDRDNQFSHLGYSAAIAMDCIEDGVAIRLGGQAKFRRSPLEAKVDIDRLEYNRYKDMLSLGDNRNAVIGLYSLFRNNTRCWEVYNELAVFSISNGNLQDAAALFEKAAAVSSDPLVPLTNLIEMYWSVGQNALAHSVFKKICENLPPSDFVASKMKVFVESLKVR